MVVMMMVMVLISETPHDTILHSFWNRFAAISQLLLFDLDSDESLPIDRAATPVDPDSMKWIYDHIKSTLCVIFE